MGVILITFGITLLSNNYLKTKREEAFNDMNLLLLESFATEEVNEEDIVGQETMETEQVPNNEEKQPVQNDFEPYLATLKIPKVNLERGFYDKASK